MRLKQILCAIHVWSSRAYLGLTFPDVQYTVTKMWVCIEVSSTSDRFVVYQVLGSISELTAGKECHCGGSTLAVVLSTSVASIPECVCGNHTPGLIFLPTIERSHTRRLLHVHMGTLIRTLIHTLTRTHARTPSFSTPLGASKLPISREASVNIDSRHHAAGIGIYSRGFQAERRILTVAIGLAWCFGSVKRLLTLCDLDLVLQRSN